jgi:Kef-type K+ transport system membrane component KefB
LLPAFFAFTGMRTQIGLVATPSDWLTCGLIVLVATTPILDSLAGGFLRHDRPAEPKDSRNRNQIEA